MAIDIVTQRPRIVLLKGLSAEENIARIGWDMLFFLLCLSPDILMRSFCSYRILHGKDALSGASILTLIAGYGE